MLGDFKSQRTQISLTFKVVHVHKNKLVYSLKKEVLDLRNIAIKHQLNQYLAGFLTIELFWALIKK